MMLTTSSGLSPSQDTLLYTHYNPLTVDFLKLFGKICIAHISVTVLTNLHYLNFVSWFSTL